ncbi:hypothetical protein [Aneurinibacillus sp. REN35]|uniref:hypothetical protein n=1 Tax=Aneurinibacillus sp. REN35 TaxID=3237286 RepID=UPI003528A2DD
MNTSLKDKQLIHHEEILSRLEEVRELRESEYEQYTLVKDKTTGEHYVRYFQRHINLMEGGVEEKFDHLLPVDTDEVLAVIFDEQDYTYPEQWKVTYLRGSDQDPYVWFDPSGLSEDLDEDGKGQELSEMLDAFKQDKKFDDDSIRKLFKDIDHMFGDE